jgi:hypothetical protein
MLLHRVSVLPDESLIVALLSSLIVALQSAHKWWRRQKGVGHCGGLRCPNRNVRSRALEVGVLRRDAVVTSEDGPRKPTALQKSQAN